MSPIGRETQIDIGADVTDRDGSKIGTVAYVVVRPPGMQITDLVVSTGAILGRDVVVPLDAVTDVEDGAVRLSITRDRLETYPDYVEVRFRQPPLEWAPPPGAYYPSTGILWPEEAYFPEAESVKLNTPPGTVGISKGMDVQSSDGHRVGSVDAVETDPASSEVTGFVVKHGFLFTRDTHIPIGDVSTVEEGQVVLRLTREQAEALESESGS